MPFLKTIITYNQPSEAEVDKAFLESNEIPVCLLNGTTSRNELGAPFYIQLQVNEEDFVRARDLLKETNPQRFGSPERVAVIDRQIKGGVFGFLLFALPMLVAIYFIARASVEKGSNSLAADAIAPWGPMAMIAAASCAGIIGAMIFGRQK